MKLSPAKRAAARKRARAELWRRGTPSEYLADSNQRNWLVILRSAEGDIVICAGRQVGKTFCVVLFLVEECANKADFIVRFASKTGKSIRKIIEPLMAIILKDCPDDLRPIHDKQQSVYTWPNGATLTYAGLDGDNQDRLRGPRANIIAFTEAGFIKDLPAAEAALGPQLQTTAGFTIYESSHAESPGHPFEERVTAAEGTGRCIKANMYDNPRLTDAERNTILRKEAEKRGMSVDTFKLTTYCRREFFNEKVIEETRAAVPSWTPELEKDCLRTFDRPKYFDGYSAHDWGGATGDPHAGLFGFYEYASGCVFIEWESERRTGDTAELVAEWKGIEAGLYGERKWEGTLLGAGEFDKHVKGLPDYLRKAISDKAQRQPFLRVCDNDEDLQKSMLASGFAVLPTEKHDKHLAVDRVVILVRQKKIIVHPRCVRLLAQLRSTIWDEGRTQWERTDKDHGDLIDCLVYLVRNVRWHRDPRPAEGPRPDAPTVPKPKAHPLEKLFARR